MKITSVMLTIAVLAGCARTGDSDVAKTAGSTAPVSQGDVMAAKAAPVSATGTVESVDVSARTVTIAHDPIAALNWPAMTMRFDAPAVDLDSISVGDQVDFQLAVDGMHGEVVRIARRR